MDEWNSQHDATRRTEYTNLAEKKNSDRSAHIVSNMGHAYHTKNAESISTREKQHHRYICILYIHYQKRYYV